MKAPSLERQSSPSGPCYHGSFGFWLAHLGGFVGGLFLGIIVLKNIRIDYWERVLFWFTLASFFTILVIAIIVNLTGAVCEVSCCSDWTPFMEYINQPLRIVDCGP